MTHLSINSPFGTLTLFANNNKIIALEWGRAPKGESSALLADAKKQLNAYFNGHLEQFTLPLAPDGTAFQRSVWALMNKIPYGHTHTYGDLAKTLTSAPRAVGGACGRNRIPIIIPCHRVIGAKGQMTGYSSGNGVNTKQALLCLERGF